MWWAAAAQVGLQMLGGINQYKLAKAQYKSQKTLDEAQYAASETIREASNELGRAQGSLANWARSVSNQRLVDSAGEQYNAISQNMGRLMDQTLKGNLQRRIQAAEQLGAVTASAAAAGVGGSTVDLISGTMRLRNSLLNQEIETQAGQATYDMLMQRAGVLDNAYDQWDFTFNLDQADLIRDVMPIRARPTLATYTLSGATAAAGAIGAYFNKPDVPSAAPTSYGLSSSGNAGTPMANGGTFFGIDPNRSSGANLRL